MWGATSQQVGIRTGSVAAVDPPGSGSDRLTGTSPDVIGNNISLFADDATGYFLAGSVSSSEAMVSSATRSCA